MKNQKSWLLSFLMIALFSVTTFATNPTGGKDTAINKQFKKHLKGLNVENLTADTKTIYIDFMINERAEILVLSTSNKELDESLKAKLNYKTIETGDMKYFTKYTIPVTFKK